MTGKDKVILLTILICSILIAGLVMIFVNLSKSSEEADKQQEIIKTVTVKLQDGDGYEEIKVNEEQLLEDIELGLVYKDENGDWYYPSFEKCDEIDNLSEEDKEYIEGSCKYKYWGTKVSEDYETDPRMDYEAAAENPTE